MGEGTGELPDATRSIVPATAASDVGPATGAHTAATALLSEPGPASPGPGDREAVSADLAPDPAAALAVGDRVGRFIVVGTLGAGGMGVVYAAYDPELDRRVAIKLLNRRERTREANLRLLREAQAMARLSHPNVVSVYDVGELDRHVVFLAMEYVDGVTLQAWLKAKRRSWREIRDVLVQAGRGLVAAHRTGLVHRDFKPANLLIDADGRARVTDFGIARLDDADDAAAGEHALDTHSSGVTPLAIDLTRTGMAIGTPAYMAPEQHRGQAVDARADQFAFCVTAWEALYGERPFAGKPGEIVRAIAAGTVRTPDGGDVPAWLSAALRRGLADAPAERWPGLDALLDRIADDPVARRRRRVALAAALVVVAGLAAGASYLAAGGERDPCASGDRELAETWSPAVKTAAAAAFRATGSPLATDHWERVVRGIDGWTASWTAARRDACEQHVRHAQSDDLYDRRVACMARDRSRLRVLVDLFAKPDAALVRESVMAVAALPPAEDCADVEALLGHRPLPADPTVRDQVAAVRAEIERVNTFRLLGRYAEALALVKDLLARADRIDYLPLRAELRWGVGMLQSDVSEAGAEQTLREGADVAATAREPALYARMWIQLIWEVGFKHVRFDDAAPLRPIAWQAVHLAGDDPDLVANLLLHEGAVDYMHGDVKAASAALERAVTVAENRHGTSDVHVVAPLNLLAVTIASEQPDRAIAVYRRALEILADTVSPNHPQAGSILGNIGNIMFEQGKFAEATDYHRRALAIVEAALGADSPDLAASLNGLAQPLWALGKWDEAFALIDRARGLWEGQLGDQHPYLAVALTNLGGLRQEQGRCAEGVPYLERARAIQVKTLPAGLRSTGMTLQFLGGCLIDLGKPTQALPLLEQALTIYEKNGTAVDQAGPRFEIARALWATGDRRRALTLAEQARAALVDDKGSQAQAAAGVKSGADEVAEWLAGKTAPR